MLNALHLVWIVPLSVWFGALIVSTCSVDDADE